MTDELKQRIAGLDPERLELFLRLSRGGEEPGGGESIPPRADPSQAPLSALQRRLFFLDRLAGGSSLYNMYAAFRLRGALDRRALVASFREMVRRHEILRARFEEAGGEPLQVLEAEPEVAIPEVDLRGLADAGERRRAADEVLGVEVVRPFDLRRAPLLRALLVELGDGDSLLAVTFHHLVADGASIAIFIREITTVYAAFSRGRRSPLAELPIHYADVAAWEAERHDDQALERRIAWWREALAGAPALLELPADRPRPARRSSRGGAVEVRLPAALTGALRQLAATESATFYIAFLAVFQAFLARLSGRSDILVGSPAAGRDAVETEGVVGPFVKTLVRRARVAEELSFRELLAQVRRAVIAADAHADLPFDKLVEALRPERHPGYTPIFQVWLVLHGAGMTSFEVPDLALTPVAVHNRTAKFDLTLEVAEIDGELRGFFEYSSDLFDAATVERWASHLATFAGRAVADADAPLGSLPLLADGEIRRLAGEWSGGGPAAGAAPLLPEPSPAVAVLAGGEELSYRELAARARRLARELRRRGVGPEVPVGLCVERGAELVVGLLATLEAGGACVPLDPSYPAERLETIVEDLGIGHLLTRQALIPGLPEAAVVCDLFCFDTDADALAGGSSEPLGESFPGESLAYVIYTSGSTGVPKGVAVSRGALAEHLGSVREVFGLGPEDRVLQFADLSFDVAFEQILATLGCGATLVLRGDEAWSTQELDRRIRDQELTVVNLPTGYWQQWLAGSCESAARPRLVIAGGDALPPAAVERWRELRGDGRLLNAYGPTEAVITASAWEVPGEDGTAVAIGRPLPGRRWYVLDRGATPVPIGVAGELHLADPLLARGYPGRPRLTAERFVPDPFTAAPGSRLYRTGDLARWRPDRTVEHLGRGDRQVKVRGFRVELGEIEAVLARQEAVASAAVTIHGETPEAKRLVAYVTPADPEAPPASDALRRALAERLPSYMMPSFFISLPELPLTGNGKLDRRALPPPVEDRAVSAVPEPPAQGSPPPEASAPAGRYQEAVIEIWGDVLGVDEVAPGDDFFELGGHSLLGTMVISEILEKLDVELPLDVLFAHPTAGAFAAQLAEAAGGATGGEARPAAPQEAEPAAREDGEEGPEPQAAAASQEYASAVAEIWGDVLGLDEVEAGDDFFEIGGHSLLGTMVISEIIDRFGVELPLDTLFAHPTAAAFAAEVERAAAPEAPVAPRIAPQPREVHPPLSFAQQRLWFLESLEPGTAVYHLPAAVRLRGPLDAGALKAALDAVVARHDALRTTFEVVGEKPVQVIAPELAVPLERVDLSALPPAEREAGLRERAISESRRPFDLARGPLLRALLAKTGDGEHTLLMTFHHIVADGWSLGILVREVAELYPALAAGGEATLPPLPVQYADFAQWQRRWLAGAELERQLGYWRQQLGGEVPVLELPFARPRPERPSHHGTFRRFDLSPECAGGLRELSRREGATLFMTSMAAFQALLYRLSGQEEFNVGTGIANRNHPGSEALIGFFVNTLVLRADLRGDPTFRELLGRVRASALGAYAHQDLPFEKLVEELRPGRELARSPLFQAMFLFQNTPMPALRVGDLELVPLRLDTGTSHFDLTLEMQDEAEGIFGVVEYSTELFDAPAIDAFIDLWVAFLGEVVRSPERPVLELPIQPPAAVAGAAADSAGDAFVFETEEG